MNVNGAVGWWTSPDSRFCRSFELGDLPEGAPSKDEMLAALNSSNIWLATVIRVVAFVLLWFGFACFFKGREIGADCAPCPSSLLGDKLRLIIPIATFPVALACHFGAAGALWVAFKPLLGIMLLSICCVCLGWFFGLRIYNRSECRRCCCCRRAGRGEN